MYVCIIKLGNGKMEFFFLEKMVFSREDFSQIIIFIIMFFFFGRNSLLKKRFLLIFFKRNRLFKK